jgi:hypothetical protein
MIDRIMGDKQKPEPESNNSPPPADDQSGFENGSRPSYYYVDATGFEIYSEETDEEDEGDDRSDDN